MSAYETEKLSVHLKNSKIKTEYNIFQNGNLTICSVGGSESSCALPLRG